MNDASQTITGMLGLWLMVQLIMVMALLLGGVYALFCLSRAAAGLDRLAGAVEQWAERESSKGEPSPSGVPTPGALRPMPIPTALIPPNPPEPPRTNEQALAAREEIS